MAKIVRRVTINRLTLITLQVEEHQTPVRIQATMAIVLTGHLI